MGKSNQNEDCKDKKNNGKQERRNGQKKTGYHKKGGPYRGKQGRKDSKDPRINLDNERVDKFAMGEKRPGANDISWYAHNPELLRSAASLPFASITGNAIGLSSNGLSNAKSKVPGIAVFGFEPCLGVSAINGISSVDDAVPYALNQAGKSTYSYIVHANSRNYTYEYQDVMMTILAASQVFACLGAIIRAYGVAKTYMEQNRYMADTLLAALGFLPDDVRNNLGQMWFQINEAVARTAQIWVPNTMPITSRWFWLNSNVYYDAESSRSQIYCYVQNHFWQFQETATPTGTSLSQYNFEVAGTPHSVDAWFTCFNDLLESLINSEDRGIMMGDILNAYGADKIYAMSPIPVDYRIAPIYNAEVLAQMENTTFSNNYQVGCVQTEKGLIPTWSLPPTAGGVDEPWRWAAPEKAILNFHQASDPTPEQIVIATRNMQLGARGSSNLPIGINSDGSVQVGPGFTPATAGSETFTRFYIYDDPQQRNAPFKTQYGGFPMVLKNSTALTATQMFDIMAFDWHPFVYYLGASGNWAGGNTTPSASIVNDGVWEAAGDYDNYIVMDRSTLRDIHDMALFSLFGVPQM